jgi:hypothetical protein
VEVFDPQRRAEKRGSRPGSHAMQRLHAMMAIALLQRLSTTQKPIVSATLTEKMTGKSRKFDRYILRYFAILQCDF